ncbi:hypothetical protein ABPG74_011424 [Tetrahymena malaccensis]
MKGDYYSVIAEQTDQTNIRNESIEQAFQFYSQGYELAEQLFQNSRIRANLGLNFSLFYYTILKDKNKAFNIAKKAYYDSIYFDGYLLYDEYDIYDCLKQKLYDNFNQWSNEIQGIDKNQEEEKQQYNQN